MRLTESQISFFHDNGYLLLEDALDETDLGPLSTNTAESLQNAPRNCIQTERLATHTLINRLRSGYFTSRMRHRR